MPICSALVGRNDGNPISTGFTSSSSTAYSSVEYENILNITSFFAVDVMIAITCKTISYWFGNARPFPTKSTNSINDNWFRQFPQCRCTINGKIYNIHSDQKIPSSGNSQFSHRMCIWRFSILTFLWFRIVSNQGWVTRYIYVKHHVLRISIFQMGSKWSGERVVCRIRLLQTTMHSTRVCLSCTIRIHSCCARYQFSFYINRRRHINCIAFASICKGLADYRCSDD